MSSSVRESAYLLLRSVDKKAQFTNIELSARINALKLSALDRAFLTALVYSEAEHRLTLDYLISQYSKTPLNRLDRSALILLRLGMTQILYMAKVPDSAAVNETVKLAARYASRAKGFINALLRRLVREKESLPLPDPEAGGLEALSICTSLPLWILQSWQKDYPDHMPALAYAAGRQPSLTLRTNPLKTNPEVLRALLPCETVRCTYAPDGLRLNDHLPISEFAPLADGLCFIQDEASQLTAIALDAAPGMSVADVCACPGGKSFSIAMQMKNQGAVYSFDLHESKLPLIREGAERMGITIIQTAVHDAAAPFPEFTGKLDRVLCDVPCSGLGVIAKKPDLRYKSQEAAEALPALQLSILENASLCVRSGGLLVYSTCTLRKAENEAVIAHFLAAHTEFSPCDFTFGNDLMSSDGMLTLFPDHLPTDGFFIARLKRT